MASFKEEMITRFEQLEIYAVTYLLDVI